MFCLVVRKMVDSTRAFLWESCFAVMLKVQGLKSKFLSRANPGLRTVSISQEDLALPV